MSQAIRERVFPSGCRLQIAQGDITDEQVEAIVNAANTHLAHGAGVAGAIVRKGGPVIQAECNRWVAEHGTVTHAEPAVTSAGNLASRYIIHAVGPVWGEGEEDEKLISAIRGSLETAERLGVTTIAFPAISTGVFGFPRERAAVLMLETIRDYIINKPGSSLQLIRIILFDKITVQAFVEAWEQDDHLGA